MTSRRAHELRPLPSRTGSVRPRPRWGDAPTAPCDSHPASSSPVRVPLPPPDAARLRRAAVVAVVLGVAALAVVPIALVAGLPLLPAGVAAGVLLVATQAAPLVVHLAHLREVRRRGEPADAAGLDPQGPLGGTAA